MSTAFHRAEARPRPWSGLRGHLSTIVIVVLVGLVLGLQYIVPDKRVIALLVAATVFGVAWRMDMVAALGVMAIALPFPRGTVFGNTNLAFILLLLVLWLLRVTQRQSAAPRRSPIDVPLLALFIAYVVSFYNVESMVALEKALELFYLMVACWLMFYVIMSNLQTERDFRRFLDFQAISVALVGLLAVYELNHPNAAFIPGWIYFKAAGGEFERNIRVGSAFHDFELLSEYAALNAMLLLFLFLRAESAGRRTLFGALLGLDVFVLFATVTKGGTISLGAGTLYLLWLVRRRVNFVTLVSVVAVLVGAFFGMNFYVANFTHSGNLMMRFEDSSQFIGLMPQSRAQTWTGAWDRVFEHPLLGHGPYYSARTGAHIWYWPHNLYLFVANNVGFIGFAIFLWLLWTLWRVSRPVTDDLRHASYVQSFTIIARVQLVVFLIDQTKVEFMRNPVYEFQVWLMFALMVAAYQIAHPAAAADGAAARRLPSP